MHAIAVSAYGNTMYVAWFAHLANFFFYKWR